MDNSSRMAEQISAEYGCRISTARRACMIENCAATGRSMEQAATLLRIKLNTVKGYTRRFNINFPVAA